jgi:peptidoglycan/LPS O-acetylase OafA/YrhL
VIARLPRWARAAVAGCSLAVGLAVMLATGAEGGWHLGDTLFLTGLCLFFVGVLWWDHHKSEPDVPQRSFTFAVVLVYVWIVTSIFEWNEALGWGALGVAILGSVVWRAWRDKPGEESGQVAGVDQRRP